MKHLAKNFTLSVRKQEATAFTPFSLRYPRDGHKASTREAEQQKCPSCHDNFSNCHFDLHKKFLLTLAKIRQCLLLRVPIFDNIEVNFSTKKDTHALFLIRSHITFFNIMNLIITVSS